MIKLNRRRSPFILSVLMSVLTAFATFAVYANHSWGGYHWARQSNPFNLKLGDNVSAVWDPILVTSSSDWSQSSVLNTTIVAGQANPRNCRPTKGRVEVCNSTYGNNGWLGIAQIWATGGHITQAVVKLNDTYFNSPPYNTTAWRNLVSCQEIGHTFGLDHQDETFDNPNLGTCMDYTNNPSTNQHPNAHDFNQLESIYAHTDNSNTVGQSTPPAAMNDIDFDGPGQWGKLIRGSREHGKSTHVLDFGNNHKIFTFVIWVR